MSTSKLQNNNELDESLSIVREMTGLEALKHAMITTNTRQIDLARALGYQTQSAISSKLKASKFDLITFVKMLDAMGYTVKITKGSDEIIIKE